MTDPHREFCRNQHRIIAHYLAVQAWLRGLDCIVLVREDLESFLALERFKGTRVAWLQEDLMPWFPHQKAYYKTGVPSSIRSLFLSRVPIEKHLPTGSMTTEARICGMAEDAPQTERFTTKSDRSQVPSHAKMVSKLSVLAAGLDAPPSYRKKARA